MRTRIILAGTAIAALSLAGCSSSSDDASETPSPSPSESATMAEGTIVEVAAGNEDFETLVAAVQAADLVDTLNGDGPFTVFAPTDEAFEDVDPEVLDLLLLPSNKDALTQVLTYHVVAGEITSADIAPGEVETVEGQPVTITVDGSDVQVNGAEVVTADVMASNGVIHVINEVLLPPGFDPASLNQE